MGKSTQAGNDTKFPGLGNVAPGLAGPNSAGDLVAVARIGAPRGVSGYLKLHSFSGEFAHLGALKEVELSPTAASVSAARKRVRIKAVESGEWGMSFQFEGYESPEKASILVGMEILVPKAAASPLREGEWYISDLIGLKLTLDGKDVAKVKSVLDGAADPLLECDLSDGRTALVPFRKEFVGKVDLESGRMELLHGWILE